MTSERCSSLPSTLATTGSPAGGAGGAVVVVCAMPAAGSIVRQSVAARRRNEHVIASFLETGGGTDCRRAERDWAAILHRPSLLTRPPCRPAAGRPAD